MAERFESRSPKGPSVVNDVPCLAPIPVMVFVQIFPAGRACEDLIYTDPNFL